MRKPKPLLRIGFRHGDVVSTRGHRFWQSGRGWVFAQDLAVGDLIHTTTGSVRVSAIEDAPREKTYNLVVDDFHTYFIGKDGLLVQDLLLPEPTNNVVPGLTRFALAAANE